MCHAKSESRSACREENECSEKRSRGSRSHGQSWDGTHLHPEHLPLLPCFLRQSFSHRFPDSSGIVYPEDQICGNHRQIQDRNNCSETGTGVRSQTRNLLSEKACQRVDRGCHKSGKGSKNHKTDCKNTVCFLTALRS